MKQEYVSRIHELRARCLSYSQIAQVMNNEVALGGFTKDIVQKIVKRQAGPHRPNATDAVRRWLETTWKAPDVLPPDYPSTRRRIMAVGDLHGSPYPAFLKHIVAANPDILVIGGDVFNQALFSVHGFTIDERREEHHTESVRLRAWFETILQQLPRVQIAIIRGNHDDRAWRRVMELVPDLAMFFVDPLDVLVEGLPRIEVVKIDVQAHRPHQDAEEWGVVRHLYPVGDAIISHAHYASAEAFYDKWMKPMHRMMNWPEPGLIVQFHTHQFQHLVREGGYLTLFEPGMIAASSVEAYKLAPSGKWKPGIQGAALFEQDQVNGAWVTDYRSVAPVWPV